jgi:hypothetical protein
MTEKLALIYIEIDINFCELTYGQAPCTAALGVTGETKCFNTRNRSADCQDPTNFTSGTKTVRFGLRDCGYLPPEIPCVPLLKSASVRNAVLKPGESIGERATVTASFYNGRSGDALLDPYVADRDYNPFEQGTFWGKWRARNTYLESRPIRIIQGYRGQTLAEMDTQHFIIDAMTGPDNGGNVTITGSDFMKLLNSDKAQAPAPSSGYLDADLAAGAGSFTLVPTGIGDLEYPASGVGVLGQEEITYTRTGDSINVSGTTDEDHEEGDTFQVLLEFTSENAATIAEDLIVNYSPLTASNVPSSTWQEIVTSFADVLYSRRIPKPTPVVELLNELIEQAGLVMYGNTRTQQIVFDVLRPNPVTGLAIGPDKILSGSFQQKDQPKKRFSSVWVFYGKRDIFEGDEPTNYYSAVIYPASENLYETPSIKKIFSKWIPSAARSVATDVAARAIARYKFPPRALQFALFGEDTRSLGQVVALTDPSIETATGAQAQIQALITGVSDSPDRHDFTAEEYNIDADDFEGDRIIQIDYDTSTINLRALYDSLYATVDESSAAPDIIFRISSGVTVLASSTVTNAIESGDWPSGVEPLLEIESGALVRGRTGGTGVGPNAGGDGGTAIEVTSAIRIDNLGTIGGGGGGGGGTVIFDGQGNPSSFGPSGANGGLGEDGETPGSFGQTQGYPGGTAGDAIQGVSLVTFISTGTILGAQVG